MPQLKIPSYQWQEMDNALQQGKR